jgi:hypothetical protein
MDIAEWLRGLGLGQYEGAFRENAIDAGVLRDLTAEDLRELGIRLIGHRRRLLTAIADLRGEGPLPVAETAPANPLPNPPLTGLVPGIAGEGEAERRQLTGHYGRGGGCRATAGALHGTSPPARRRPEDLFGIMQCTG